MTDQQKHAMRQAAVALERAMTRLISSGSTYRMYRDAQHALLVELEETIEDVYREIRRLEEARRAG